MDGARQGLSLCLQTVIPSLFPFIFVSSLLTSGLSNIRFKKSFSFIPAQALPAFTIGLLGGYPTGAQSVSHLYRNGVLVKETAERLLSICNNCGPAFVFGILSGLFSSPMECWIIWGILLLGNWIFLMLNPIPPSKSYPQLKPKSTSCSEAMTKALRAIVSICGWIVIFRIITEFLNRWFLWMFPPIPKVLFIGLLELTLGCLSLKEITNESVRFILCVGMISFGGCCVTMQTKSVIHPDLNFKKYFPGKVMYCIVCILLAVLLKSQFSTIGIAVLLIIIMIHFLLQIAYRKKSRFSEHLGV